MSADPLARVRAALAARQAAGLWRVLRPRAADEDVLELAGNDYLGLARDPRVTAAAAQAAREWGAGSTGSRLVTGTTQLHAELEGELAAFTCAPAALVFSSGYLANLGVLTALGGPDVTIVSDAGNHASIIDACRLSGAPVVVFPHRDLEKLDAALAVVATPHAVVVTDAVFSVDGDLAQLPAMHEISRRHQAILVVDEAHALGVVGDGGVGAVAAAGLAGAPDIIRTITLSKALGSQGGAVLGAPEVIDLLVNTARAFIFDTGPGTVVGRRGTRRPAHPRCRAVAGPGGAGQRGAVGGHRARAQPRDDRAGCRDRARLPRRPAARRRRGRGLPRRGRAGGLLPAAVGAGGRSCLRLTARADLTVANLDRAATVLRAALT